MSTINGYNGCLSRSGYGEYLGNVLLDCFVGLVLNYLFDNNTFKTGASDSRRVNQLTCMQTVRHCDCEICSAIIRCLAALLMGTQKIHGI